MIIKVQAEEHGVLIEGKRIRVCLQDMNWLRGQDWNTESFYISDGALPVTHDILRANPMHDSWYTSSNTQRSVYLCIERVTETFGSRPEAIFIGAAPVESKPVITEPVIQWGPIDYLLAPVVIVVAVFMMIGMVFSELFIGVRSWFRKEN